jgi:hypothetical protein
MATALNRNIVVDRDPSLLVEGDDERAFRLSTPRTRPISANIFMTSCTCAYPRLVAIVCNEIADLLSARPIPASA